MLFCHVTPEVTGLLGILYIQPMVCSFSFTGPTVMMILSMAIVLTVSASQRLIHAAVCDPFWYTISRHNQLGEYCMLVQQASLIATTLGPDSCGLSKTDCPTIRIFPYESLQNFTHPSRTPQAPDAGRGRPMAVWRRTGKITKIIITLEPMA